MTDTKYALVKENRNDLGTYGVLSKPLGMEGGDVRVWNSNWDLGAVGQFESRQLAINVARVYGGVPEPLEEAQHLVEVGHPLGWTGSLEIGNPRTLKHDLDLGMGRSL